MSDGQTCCLLADVVNLTFNINTSYKKSIILVYYLSIIVVGKKVS